jgi:hypothetical protein
MFSEADYNNAKIIDLVVKKSGDIKNIPCFQGAWYYKLVTDRSRWLGIEASIVLPNFTPDFDRFEYVDLNNRKVKRYLDTPSVYLGGSADFETDIGFGFFHGIIDGRITEEKITFRPFWRTIFIENGQETNRYLGTRIEETEYYYFPGDEIKISLTVHEVDYLTLRISLVKPTEIEPYKTFRSKLSNPKPLITEPILAPGNGLRDSEFKIVTAIDQYHNEGKPTQKTKASTIGCLFKDVYLFIVNNNELSKIPFFKQNYYLMACPDKRAFISEINQDELSISILPKRTE